MRALLTVVYLLGAIPAWVLTLRYLIRKPDGTFPPFLTELPEWVVQGTSALVCVALVWPIIALWWVPHRVLMKGEHPT